jgi:uncharacterized protein YecT (DUF1311 family)
MSRRTRPRLVPVPPSTARPPVVGELEAISVQHEKIRVLITHIAENVANDDNPVMAACALDALEVADRRLQRAFDKLLGNQHHTLTTADIDARVNQAARSKARRDG